MVSKNARGRRGVARYFTFLGMLHACVSIFALEDGKHVHKEIIPNNCRNFDVCVNNALIYTYTKCRCPKDALSSI
jgi:hypothetical protein